MIRLNNGFDMCVCVCLGDSEFFGEWRVEGVWKLFWGGERCYVEEWRDYKYKNMKEEEIC